MTRHDDASWEAAILPRLRTGEPAAQRELVSRYNATLVRQALFILEDRALAEEAVQDSWMAALARIHRFSGRSRLLTWLAGIVINRARSERRREIRSVPLSSLTRSDRWPGQAANDDTEGWELRVDEATPEQLLLEREARSRFDAAVWELPEGQRSVVLLRAFRGASPEETCQFLDISDAAQRVRLCRARATLRDALRELDSA